MKETLMSWAVGSDGVKALSLTLPPFIKNKLAHLLVTIVQVRMSAHSAYATVNKLQYSIKHT